MLNPPQSPFVKGGGLVGHHEQRSRNLFGVGSLRAVHSTKARKLNAITNTELLCYPPLFRNRGQGEFEMVVLYRNTNKPLARKLRSNLSDAEQRLWLHIGRKPIIGIQFYRQKPLLGFIVDFYCPCAQLVIEIDGGQHFEVAHVEQGRLRDCALAEAGLKVLRFDNRQVLSETESVLEQIHFTLQQRLQHG